MDPDLEIARTVKENRRLIEENNKMLKKISRYMVANVWIKVAYWVIILGSAFGVYYLIQPYLDAIKDGVGQAQEVGTSVKEATTLSGVLDSFKDILK
ncbi:hypothetical protein COW81_02270 [Candidatus Campbellbacteria bacterium CG22_combo_CG10-13_8_21_14_all_36_13]|uniref:Uncharacterized protein n=1 Tax=Candidatus Campbellbacteria bacterium CG22_combo_CG10-13_8_21_14_all_36_13 TaxID=1974529 RepID=A0A2H0DY15_9BACT|nr:MAG: hypothetical protein COW81_02270 [Candidatus Campbellbacteria bacterium CG22_combo_CG10-13_8_21_14_all_36_13]